MRSDIDKVSGRARLAPRREPYWGPPLSRGLFLGYRSLADGGTWVARWRDDDGRQRYKSLGHVSPSLDYEEARKLAVLWHKNQAAGVDDTEVVTVADAGKRYVAHQQRTKDKAAARDVELRFARLIDSAPIGKVKLARLSREHIERWRSDLLTREVRPLARSTANRELTALKAALNLAVKNRHVGAERATEWETVEALTGAGKPRDLFLDLKQRRALIEAATGGARDLIEATAQIGARPGELCSARRSQFDARTGMLKLSGKTGTRTIPLAPAALRVFERLATNKLPGAFLFTRDDGQPWKHAKDRSTAIKAAVIAAKIPAAASLYTLRHSYITEAILSGVTTLEVARLTGTSLVMIERTYGHLVTAVAQDRLAKVEFA